MQLFKNEMEVNEFCDTLEKEIASDKYTEAISRVKTLEVSVKTEARRELEKRSRDVDYLVKDSCESIIAIANFDKYSVEEIYQNLSSYILSRHNETFLQFHPVMRRIEILVKSMVRIYEKYCVPVTA